MSDTATTSAPQPETMERPTLQGVVPYLMVRGASEAAEWYKRAFGAEEVMRMPEEGGTRLMHCHLRINNGDLFTDVLAFSPGFMAPALRVGAPRFFVSHGTRDGVLPIERCSRRIVPQLERMGYGVTYREFDGGHTVPPEIALEAAGRFALDERGGKDQGST